MIFASACRSAIQSFVSRQELEYSKSDGGLNERALDSCASPNRAHFRPLIRIINRTWARLSRGSVDPGTHEFPNRDSRDQLRDSPGRGQMREMRRIKRGTFRISGCWGLGGSIGLKVNPPREVTY